MVVEPTPVVPPPLDLLLGPKPGLETQTGSAPISTASASGVLLLLDGKGRTAFDDLDQRLSRLARDLDPEAPVVVQGAACWGRWFGVLFGRWRNQHAPAASPVLAGDCTLGPHAVLRLLQRHGFQVTGCYQAQAPAGSIERLDAAGVRALYSAPAFIITACLKPSRARVSLYQAMDAMGPEVAGSVLSRLVHSARGKSIAFVSNASGSSIVRVAYGPAMRLDESRGHELLVRLHARPSLSDRLPRPQGLHNDTRYDAYAQRQMVGKPLSSLAHRSNRGAWLPEVRRFWFDLHADLVDQEPGDVQDLPGPAVPGPMIEFVLGHVRDPALQADARQVLNQLLDGACSRLGVVHGDFGAGNLLFHQGRLSAVIDWEAGRDHAPPVLDVINYLDSIHRVCERTDLGTSLELLLSHQWPQPDESRFLAEAFELCAIEPRHQRGFILLYFMFHIGPQLRFVATESGPSRRLQQVLQRLTALALA